MIRPVLIPMKAVQTYSNRIHPYWILAGDVFNAIESVATLKSSFFGGEKAAANLACRCSKPEAS